MANPWTKKNPFLSMWLSGLNAILGAARGQTMAAAKRQASTVATAVARASAKPARKRTRVSTTTPKRKKRTTR